MTTVDLRIELPAYSHSFNVHVHRSSNVQQVKEEISKACPGQPRADGQRLIWRGRNLGNEERVEDLWKSPSDSRILHLAVHPSSWTDQPPQLPNPDSSVPDRTPMSLPLSPPPIPSGFSPPPTHPLPTPASFPFPTPAPLAPPAYRPIPFIAMKHQNALNALVHGTPTAESTPELRDAAKSAIERFGFSWPTVLDESYPEYQPGGLRYEAVFLEGRHYLSLVASDAAPTPVQQHALNVLSFTFSLLNLSVTESTIIARSEASYSDTNPVAPQVNQYLRQMGFPQIRVVQQVQNPIPNQNNILPQLRELPLRPLMMPIFMLAFRTVLLLYFVAPTRKPIFGVLILAWMLYEIWQPIRNGLIRARNQRANNANNQDVGPAGAGGADNAPLAQQGGVAPANLQQPPFGEFGARQLDAQAAAILDALGNLNLTAEEDVIQQSHLNPIPEPGWGHKLTSFLGLLFGTLHPAVWNRRRTALNRREGVIRTEANMRREPSPRDPNEEETDADRAATEVRQELRERHAHRPRWVQQYMERVVAEEWVDDLD